MHTKHHGVGPEAASYDSKENKKERLCSAISRYVGFPKLSVSHQTNLKPPKRNTIGVIINQNGVRCDF